MSSINAQLKLAVKASGRSELKGIASDIDKLNKAIEKARDKKERGPGFGRKMQGPLMPSGGFFSGPAAPTAEPPAAKAAKRSTFSVLKFAAASDLAASNFERVAGAGKAILTKPIQDFFSLESAMARVQSKMDVLSTEDYARLKKAAIDTGAATGYSSKEAADGLGEMAAAGFNAEQQIAALPAVLQLARAGELDVGAATAVAASTMSQFGLKAQDTAHIGDVLVAAANASVISVADLGETLKYVGPIAHTAGISLEETTAAAAVLGNAGIEASMAGTGLRGTIAAFAKQTPKATKAMASFGITTKQMSEGVHEPIKLLELLGKKMEHASEGKKLKALSDIFGAPSAPAAASLMEAISKVGDDGLTAIGRARQATNNANGQLARAAAILGGTGEAKLKKFQSQISAVSAEIGEVLAPTLLEGTKTASDWVKNFGEWAKENPNMVSGLGKITFGLTGISLAAAAVARVVGAGAPLWSGLASGASMAATGIKGTVAGMERMAVLAGASQGAATAITGLFAVPAAAAAGWWLGSEIDSAIGKLFNLRGELASTEAALKIGENTTGADGQTLDPTDATDGPEFQRVRDEQNARWEGFLSAVVPGYAGNLATNRDRGAAKPGVNGSPATGAVPFNAAAGAGFNAVTGKLEVFVTDDRVRTKLSGNAGRLGHAETR